jgi:Tubulin-tyrosine ligase family
MLKSARLQYGEVFDFFPRSHVFTHHSKDLLSQYFDRPGRLWIGKPAASSQGRGIHITKSLKDFAKYLAPLPSPKAQSVLKQKTENVSISAAEGDKTDVTAEPATKKGRDVVIVRTPFPKFSIPFFLISQINKLFRFKNI